MRNDQRKELAGRIAGALPLPASPFADTSGPSAFAVPDDAPEGTYAYRVVQSGPPVASEECEVSAAAVEVRVLWGSNVLAVRHLRPDASFYIGEHEQGALRCDFFVPRDKLEALRRPLLLEGRAIVPSGARACVRRGDAPEASLAEAAAEGLAVPHDEGHAIALDEKTQVRVMLDDLTFEITGTRRGKKAAAAFSAAAVLGGGMLYVMGSLVGHAGLLAAMAMFTPPLGSTADDAITDEQRYLIQQYLDVSAATEQEERPTEQLASDTPDGDEGGTGVRSKGEEGKSGDPNAAAADARWAIRHQQEDEDPAIARAEAIRMAQTFGAIGLLSGGGLADPDAITAPWGGLVHNGDDPISARGNMWGSSLGDAYGPGGLGLSGVGEGGGGIGEGVGLGSIGTIGHGAGLGPGQGIGDGMGNSVGRVGRPHRAKAPNVRIAPVSVSGRLPPEVIQRIVRQNYGRFRACYESGLRNNPSLQGRVSVSFVIGRDGRVSNVGGSGDIPDGGVVSCITRAFYGLSFPQPDGGIVTVRYPLVLTPAG